MLSALTAAFIAANSDNTLISAAAAVVDIIVCIHTCACAKCGVTGIVTIIAACSRSRTFGRTIGGSCTDCMTAAAISNGIDFTTCTGGILVIIGIAGEMTGGGTIIGDSPVGDILTANLSITGIT